MSEGSSKSAEIEYELTAEGFRMTKLRTALLSIFADNMRPFSVDEITKALEKKKVVVHKVSLYRELEVLTKADAITPIYFQDSLQRYEFVQHNHHHHIVCIKCNKFEDVEIDDKLDKEARRLEKRTKFSILKHSLEFFGLCPSCTAK